MIPERLFALQDPEYAAFQAKLTPTVDPVRFIGVRVPDARRLAKELAGNEETADFLRELPHRYYDENILHALLISEMRDYDRCIDELDRFLPYVDNWAVCDILSPKVLGKQKDRLLEKIREWAASPEIYTCRFGLEMLMRWYLDDAFKPEYLELPAAAGRREEYYVKMMAAWFFATALAKQWEMTVPYLEDRRLEIRVHNKTIQKARESFRISPEQKAYLNSLKR